MPPVYPRDKPSGDKNRAGKNGGEVSIRRLNDDVLKRKKEGWVTVFVPIAKYNSDLGFGGGAIMMIAYNGNRFDSRFGIVPYNFMMAVQGYASTLGQQVHFIMADIPRFLGSPVRIKTRAEFKRHINEKYFGIGRSTTGSLLSRNGQRFSTFSSYRKNYLEAYDPFNPLHPLYYKPVNYKFNNYIITRPMFYLRFYVDLPWYMKLRFGFNVKYSSIRSWMFRKFDTRDAKRVLSAPTMIDIDPHVAGKRRSGWVNEAYAGFGIDTRDFEPDPRNGLLFSYTFSAATPYLGSDFGFFRHTAELRGYWSPVRVFTVAARLGYMTTDGTVPFHEIGKFNFYEKDEMGLGNNRTLRGYQRNRFTGHTMTVANLELRWEFIEFLVAKQHVALKLLAFVDTGSVFDYALEPATFWSGYRFGYGTGFVIAYNQAAIIHFYAGFSSEDYTISVDVEHSI